MAATDSPPADQTRAVWRRVLGRAGLVYLFSRMCVVVGAGAVAAELRSDANKVDLDLPNSPFADPNYLDKAIPRSGLRLILDTLTSWDGQWYNRIIENGYPRVVQAKVTYEVADARAAFFPAYPMLVRSVDWVLPVGSVTSALIVNVILGAAAVLVAGLLARQIFGVQVSSRAMALMALFPGAFVLSFAYTEALLITVAAACMLFLLRRQWWLAGVFAAIGTATRPNGIALCAACAVAAYVAIRDDRDWKSLIAVVLSPLGFLGFQLFLWQHTGEALVWFRVQTEAWGEGASFGYTAIKQSAKAIANPLTSPTATITALSVAALVCLCAAAYKRRLPAPIAAYCVVIVLLMLLPATVTARPRFLYTAFPLLFSLAALIEPHPASNGVMTPRRSEAWAYIVGICCAGLAVLTALYGVLGAIP
ncbi:MAG TPA: glycosyltransferase family 39 protein [Ilumatobacteraceae bacterium]|nr:glycosyltransferase family 39 protein [Ilumatobacteraceae bacterium]